MIQKLLSSISVRSLKIINSYRTNYLEKELGPVSFETGPNYYLAEVITVVQELRQ